MKNNNIKTFVAVGIGAAVKCPEPESSLRAIMVEPS